MELCPESGMARGAGAGSDVLLPWGMDTFPARISHGSLGMGGITLFFGPGCAEEFMSCPCGEWTWAEHHQHCVLGKLCPPGFGAAQRLLAFNYKQLNNVSQLTAGKRKGRNGS